MSGNILRKLSDAGLTIEQAALVMDIIGDEVAAYKQADDVRKAVTRERVQRWRDNHREAGNVTETSQKRNGNATKRLTRGDAHVEFLSSEVKEEKKEESKKTNTAQARESGLAEFKTELLDVDDERLDAFVKLRRSKRGQVSGLSARLFRGDAEACGLSVSDAVDTCIRRNWITVQPEYLEGRKGNTPTAPPNRKQNYVDAAKDILNRRANGHGTAGIFDIDGDAQRISTERIERPTDPPDVRSGASRRFSGGGH